MNMFNEPQAMVMILTLKDDDEIQMVDRDAVDCIRAVLVYATCENSPRRGIMTDPELGKGPTPASPI